MAKKRKKEEKKKIASKNAITQKEGKKREMKVKDRRQKGRGKSKYTF